MKKISFVFALVFAKMATAQSLNVSLDMNGVFQKATSTVRSGYHSGKTCRADQGKYLGRGRCRIDHATATIAIEKSEISDAYKIDIQSMNSLNQTSQFTGYGANINRVQLIVPVSDQCQLTVMFTSPTTLSTVVSGDCGEEEKAALTINNLVRK
ncbi:MAG: hypothetical protein H7256_13040 [Bdellovibrio sp.]|nr:hypothetical protein [Bdellovibrio sp.]